MTDLLAKAKALTTGFQPGHSRFQIENFIIGKQGTPYAQWQQCRREIQVRIGEAEKQDDTAMRELEILVALAEGLERQIGKLTPSEEELLEVEAWDWKAKRKIDIDFMVYGRPTESTVEFILSFPTERQESLFAYMEIRQRALAPVKETAYELAQSDAPAHG